MKYIKLFEGFKDDLIIIGDNVRIRRGRSYSKFQKKLFNIYSIQNPSSSTYKSSDLCGIKSKKGEILYFPAKDLIKMTKKEVAQYLLAEEAEKYNL